MMRGRVLGPKKIATVFWAGMSSPPLKSGLSSFSVLLFFSYCTENYPLPFAFIILPNRWQTLRQSVERGGRYWSQQAPSQLRAPGSGWECELWQAYVGGRGAPRFLCGSLEMADRVSSLRFNLRRVHLTVFERYPGILVVLRDVKWLGDPPDGTMYLAMCAGTEYISVHDGR